MKLLRILFLSILCAVASPVFAQLNIGSVDPGPYTPGSTIAATFVIDPATCIAPGNVFRLRMSDANGNYAPGIVIGTYNSFYSTFVNGIIPIGTPAGTGYTVRIESTTPAFVSAPSTAFEVRAGTAVESKLLASSVHCAFDEAFGFNISRSGAAANIDLVNQSTTGGAVVTTIHNETAGTNTTITFDTQQKTFTPDATHYTAIVKTVMPDGRVATKAYFIINNRVNTSFTTSGAAYVCLPGGSLQYFIDVTSTTGIQNNFPGNTYKINWGDATENNYTFCDLKGGVVSHSYIKSSCGQTYASGNTTIYNAFGINVQVVSPFCGNVGTGVSTTAKVVEITQNLFQGPTLACTNTLTSFVNNSILGQDPENTGPVCKPDNSTFNWYVDGVLQAANRPKSFVFTYTFATHGIHKVRLESTGTTGCVSPVFEQEICVQDPPKPSFTLPSTAICSGTTLIPTNTSVIDIICNNTSSYVWSVTPSAGVTYAGGTTATSQTPQFSFANAGIYNITLIITTTTCGAVSTLPQQIVVNASPIATLSPDVALCNLATYDFNATTTGPTKTILTGTAVDLSDTYTWTVTGGSYGFTGTTNANSKYPSIKFNDYTTYTITVVHKNNCGTATSTQQISFSTSPTVNAGPDQTICYNTPSVSLTGSVVGATTTNTWVGGTGTFTQDRNDMNATYTPSVAERNAGQVTLTLRAITALAAPCNSIDDNIIITIKPNITITSANAKTICTGINVNYTPTSATAGTVFNWTATGSANAAGFTASGTGNITDVLTNSDALLDATVTYIITPSANGCFGDPFTFTVTVKPNPIVTVTAANPSICSGQVAGISISSNLAGTKYTWTSTKSAGITGNSANATASAVTSINDILINPGTTVGTVNYVITPVSANGCLGNPFNISITVEPTPTTPNAGADESVCNATSYTFKGNVPVVGTGKWTQVTTFTGITINDDDQFNGTAFGLQPGNTYIFRWTISGASNCSPKIDDVSITVNPPSFGGTTNGNTAVCAGTNTGQITLIGQVGNVVRWESSLDGTNWNTINNTTTSLTFNNLATTTQFRAVVQSGVCATANSTITTVTVNQGAVAANAGIDQNLCNSTTTTLAGNSPLSNTGLWTLVSGQTGVTFADATLYNTTVNGLVGGQSYTFRWTVSGLAPCPASSDDVIIANLAPLLNNNITTPQTTACNGQVITLAGATPTGGNSTYTYIWQSSPNGLAPWTTINGQTLSDLTITVASNLSYRRIVNSGACTTNSNVITIIALPPIANNTIAADQIICLNLTPNQITGSQPTGGDGTNYTYGWEQSVDNGLTWAAIIGASAQNYAPAAITQTTQYRRIVSSAACTGSLGNVSNIIKITVNPNAKAEYTYIADVGCIPFVIEAANIKAVPYPDRNAVYTWYADGVIIGTGITFPGYTIAIDNKNVVIKLVTTSSLGCVQDEMSHTFSTRQDITPSYTQSAVTGCGPLVVNFNNTSSSLTGVTFKWDFGNGVTSNLVSPGPVTFLPDPSGEDIIYNVSLEVTTPCGSKTTTSTVTVKANPISAFSPNKTIGCSPLSITFSNTSPGGSNTFYYDFGDGTNLTTTSKAPVTHIYTTATVQDYIVKMTATNECGVSTSQYSIRALPNTITPELVVNSNQLSGCAPLTVDFFNNTKGATNFKYTFGDGGFVNSNTLVPEKQTHTFTIPGTYVVELVATNGCSTAITTETITVYPQPKASFDANFIIGCTGLMVKFSNTSIDGVSYLWDFGDGTTSTVTEPIHVFTGSVSTAFTVTLTVYNDLGCPAVLTKTDYIKIVGPPKADFSISPAAVISIPNYNFKFTNESTNGPQTYKWSFGDGDISSQKDPNHTYADTGKYLVTLRSYNEQGCVDSIQKYVQIVGVPGYVYVPNSFIPGGSSSALQTFIALGSGMKTWRMQVFNKWGQVLWETTKLDDGKPIEGWDGNYKGQPQPQGIYFWKIEVELINGTEWKGMTFNKSAPKRTGEIYLIR